MTKHGFLDGLFLEHPRSVGESYAAHRATAWSFGGRMLVGAFAAFIHGLFPGLCVTTASRIVRDLHKRLEDHKRG